MSLLLEFLTPRERRVLQLRYGLIDGQERTVQQVGQRFGVPGTRIEQIEGAARQKLKSSGLLGT